MTVDATTEETPQEYAWMLHARCRGVSPTEFFPSDGLGVDRVEHEVVYLAPELGTHGAFARGCPEDHGERLLDVVAPADERKRPAVVDRQRERQA